MKNEDSNWITSAYQHTEDKTVFKNVDLKHWAKMPYWTYLELTCVTLGFEPGPILSASIDQLRSSETDFKNISKRAQLAHRAVEIDELPKTILPKNAIDWLASINEDYPKELHELIMLLPIYAAGPLPNVSSSDVTNMLNACEKLSGNSQSVEQFSANSTSQTKEITSLQKMLLTTTIKGYGFDPNAKRSAVYGEISQDAEAIGLDLHTDTVRKHVGIAVDNHWCQIDE